MILKELYGFDNEFQGDLSCPILEGTKKHIIFGGRRKSIRKLSCENCPVAICYKDMPQGSKDESFMKVLDLVKEEIQAVKEYVNQRMGENG